MNVKILLLLNKQQVELTVIKLRKIPRSDGTP